MKIYIGRREGRCDIARRRMIDPKFWSDETVAKLSIEERLFYVGLFSLADDMGRMCGSPVYLRSQIYPYDDIPLDKVVTWIQHLNDVGLIHVYNDPSGDGSQYVDHPKWLKYQRLDNPSPSLLPPCPFFRSHWRKPRTILRKTKNHSQNDSKNHSCLKEVKGSLKRKGKEVKGKGREGKPENQNPFPPLSSESQKPVKTENSNQRLKKNLDKLDELKRKLQEKLGREPTVKEMSNEIWADAPSGKVKQSEA